MWARTVEVMLGLWLAASPFIFRHPPDESLLWWNDFGCALLILVFSLFAFWHRTRRAHLLNLLVAGWLIGLGYVGSALPSPPAAQNQLTVGIVLLMLAILPSQASLPPPAWREARTRETSETRGQSVG